MLRTAALLLVLLPDVRPVPARDVYTPELVNALRTVSAAALSPDGARVAFTLSVPRRAGVDEDGGPWAELHVVDVEGGRTRGFVTGEVNVSAASWSADGREIAFLAKRGADKETALYLIPVDGGESRRALALGGGIEGYDLAPDGKRVVCIAAPAKDAAREKLRDKGFKQEVYEEDGKRSELWVATLDGSAEPRQLAFDGHPRDVRWSPVDERLLVAWTPTTLVEDDYMEKRVAVLDGASGEVLARIENPGKLGEIAWSPDGTRVGLIAAADLHDPSPGRMCVAPASGGVPEDLVPGFQGDALDFAWQKPDALLVVTHVGLGARLEKIELGGAPREPRVLVQDAPILTAITLARDGQSAAFVGSTAAHPAEAFHMRHGESAPRRLTDSNPALAGLALARQ